MNRYRSFARADYKRAVEESAHPASIWSALYDEILLELSVDSDEAAAISSLFDFAVAWQKKKFGHYFYNDAWLFFHLTVGAIFFGNQNVKLHLPRRISWKEFEAWAGAIGKSENELRFMKSRYSGSAPTTSGFFHMSEFTELIHIFPRFIPVKLSKAEGSSIDTSSRATRHRPSYLIAPGVFPKVKRSNQHD